ncbi:MAG TPA: ATP-binding protein [Puia sp.]|uniref:ATP-binding protein n=1 Tax=Puia sp. TaxID=2045100 RepID=UPI002BC81529|nr:ATP-binding protein [Puia sp.]HVU97935.1 ATP-binding protein [Puia sp.]
MIQRDAASKILELAEKFPAIGLLGPRQSGKTTLAKTLFSDKPYVSFENQDTLLAASTDPRAFLSKYSEGAVFDEIQRVPHLFSYLQGIIDERTSKTGLFILTGSQNFLLLENITQSLAGRIAFIHLLPFSYHELRTTEWKDSSLDFLIFHGGYPRLYDKVIEPVDYYPNYILTYVERDVRQIKNINDLGIFQRFLKVCATRVGQIINYASIGNDCGIDQKTVVSWLGILETSFIATTLKPFYNNLGKRLLQMPKLYFYDTGLCCSLLEIENQVQLANHPLRGALFENFVLLELLKQRLNRGLRSNFYFWRDRTGNEIDILLDRATGAVPIEIKASATYNQSFLKGIEYWRKIQPGTTQSFLIYTGETSFPQQETEIINWKELNKIA